MAEEKLTEAGIVGADGAARPNLFDLIIKDAETDLAIIRTMRENITALRGWLGSIGNAKTRDTFKAFLDDTSQVTTCMSGQKKLIVNHLTEMKARWETMEKKQSEKAHAPSAEAPASAPTPESSSASPAAEPAPQG